MAKEWKEKGYMDFADGEFGNGGQNIYVSRAGILQRIFWFDYNRDGYADLIFVNSQDMWECPPVYVMSDPCGKAVITELPTQGAYAGAVGDLNGDGFDDLVVANQHNGVHSDITAYVYYGSYDGLSRKYRIELPAPNSTAAAIGDFNGDGRPDIALSSEGKLRVFYQTKEGFLPGNFLDYEIDITHMASADFDGDGYCDLYVRMKNGGPFILWGGSNGIDMQSRTPIGKEKVFSDSFAGTTAYKLEVTVDWLPKILKINGTTYLFRKEGKSADFYFIHPDRDIELRFSIECEHVVSAASGDINGDGYDDLVLAVCGDINLPDYSYVYWGSNTGFNKDNRTYLPTLSARDVAVGDLNSDGYSDIAVCQGRTDKIYTTESLIYMGSKNGVVMNPLRFVTHDAVAALIARTGREKNPLLIFINHESGRYMGDVDVYIYYGGPDGFLPKRRDELPGWSAPGSICCDFNDDGWPDILVANCAENAVLLGIDPGSYLYWGGPHGFDKENKLVIPTVRGRGTAAGDFRHSGYIDLAVVGFANAELTIYEGRVNGFDLENPKRIILDKNLADYTPPRPGHTLFTAARESPEFSEPGYLLAADFNNDGWLDLFVSQGYGQHCIILWGGPEGFSMERAVLLPAEGSISAQAADLNNDGWLDLIVGSCLSMSKKWVFDTYVYIYWGGPEGFSQDRCTQLPSHMCISLTVADFDNDGMLDLFVSSYNSGRSRDLDAYIYWGGPGGIYSEENRTRLFTHSSCGSLAADFNEDGWVDLAVANHKTYGNHVGYSQVWWNGPEGFSEKRITWLPTLGPHGMTSVDTGNIMNRGPEEFYISSAFKLPEGAVVLKICWEAELFPKTWVKAQIRFARSKEELKFAKWQGPDGSEDWFENGQTAGKIEQDGTWIQYRLALGALNSGNSPRVKEVSVYYQEGNILNM